MTFDVTSVHLLAEPPRVAPVAERHTYSTAAGPLPFDLVRPLAAGPSPVVVFVMGAPDPGAAARFGKPFWQWASYRDWASQAAAAGIAAVLYENRDPADVSALLHHLRAHAAALGIDPARIGIWACSGHGPTAVALLAREPLACAALLYPYLVDLDGDTAVARMVAAYGFAAPPVTLDALPAARPILVVRAGADATPGLDAGLVRFVAAARARGLAVRQLDVPGAPHAFDLVADAPATRAAIRDVLAFLAEALAAT